LNHIDLSAMNNTRVNRAGRACSCPNEKTPYACCFWGVRLLVKSYFSLWVIRNNLSLIYTWQREMVMVCFFGIGSTI